MRYLVLALASFSVAAADIEETAQAVVERTNAFRKSQGLEPQAVNPALAQAARDFAGFMAKTGKYGHAADGRKPAERAAAHGYEYCIVLENIAYLYRSTGYDTATLGRELVEGWRKSPEHRRNMLDPAATQPASASRRARTAATTACRCSGGPRARRSASASRTARRRKSSIAPASAASRCRGAPCALTPYADRCVR
jgi:hypothetical protein